MMPVKVINISGADAVLGTWMMQRIPRKDESVTIHGTHYRVINIETIISYDEEQYILYVI